MAFILELDKLACKILDIDGEIIPNHFFSILCLGGSMVDGTIGLPLGQQTPVDCGLSNETISTIMTDGMKHRKINCAQGPL